MGIAHFIVYAKSPHRPSTVFYGALTVGFANVSLGEPFLAAIYSYLKNRKNFSGNWREI